MSTRLFSSFSLFKQRTPRPFDFTTRYYDETKERKAEIDAMLNAGQAGIAEAELRKELLSKRIRHQWQRKHTDRASNMRFVFVLAALCGVLYVIFKNYVPV